jgi:hypothetical protein
MNVAVTTSPEHIPANLLRDIDPWQLLMSARQGCTAGCNRCAVTAVFRTVRSRLAPGGRFVFTDFKDAGLLRVPATKTAEP